MQTIETKYLAPTEYRGSRIKVMSEWGSKTYAYDYAADEPHDAAFDLFLLEKNKEMAELFPDHEGPWWSLVAKAGSLSHRGNVYIIK